MAVEYSVEVCRALEEKFRSAGLHRPMRVQRYDPGQELIYDVTTVKGSNSGRVRLLVEKFVGGGYAGQVYRVKLLGIEANDGPLEGLETGAVYAIKILIPPSGFSRLFRNILYRIGFQGPFQLQVNPAAARTGALWQKFIQRGAKIKFGSEDSVVDIHATFVDGNLGSCGEISEWVDGRTWRLEVDERLDLLKRWGRGKDVDLTLLASPEYRAKRRFMAEFVKLLHEMGAPEFARQYEWSTCKSQPNCLKRQGTDNDPSAGLVAVDFRAGLALLPFLPMSPGDFALIAKGLGRGSLVQFDRGDLNKLQRFVDSHADDFDDMRTMLEELQAVETTYRNSVPDITHNHVRLFYSSRLWSTMLDSAVTGWKVKNLIDQKCEQNLRKSTISTLLFFVLGLIPFLGRVLRKTWGRADYRNHYVKLLTSWAYFQRAIRARIAEKAIVWYRAGRVSAERASKLAEQPLLFLGHLPLSILPASLHRFLADADFRRSKLVYIFVRPIRLYFNAHLREQWLRDMVTEGKKKHMLSDEDERVILSQINEPFIQKYLMSLVVHLLTLPITQIVSVIVAYIYVETHAELTWQQATAAAGVILIAFQVTPISPGSLTRGFYVLYRVIRERNFKDYNIAVFLGFFKYIGYLAFPIQMTYHYPVMARFMAAHWATEAVHIVPVFGERGALLEHWVFRLFYNWPLTIRRRMQKRAQIRASLEPRYWHIGLIVLVGAGIFALFDFGYFSRTGLLPRLRDIWWLVVVVPFVCGAGVTLGCGGMALVKRLLAACACGILVGVLYTGLSAVIGRDSGIGVATIAAGCVWRVFVFAVLSAIGAIFTELKLPEPALQ